MDYYFIYATLMTLWIGFRCCYIY